MNIFTLSDGTKMLHLTDNEETDIVIAGSSLGNDRLLGAAIMQHDGVSKIYIIDYRSQPIDHDDLIEMKKYFDEDYPDSMKNSSVFPNIEVISGHELRVVSDNMELTKEAAYQKLSYPLKTSLGGAIAAYVIGGNVMVIYENTKKLRSHYF